MNKPKARTPRRLIAGLAAGTLVLAACGSDSNDAEEVETTEAVEEVGTIVDVAVSNGSFETLVAAVTAADLVDTLSSEGPFTVFAPTDDAFAALPDGLLDALLLPENVDALQAILTYHVLGAEVPSSDVAPGDVDTVQGEAITIAADGDTLTVNDATITAVDVEASNGVIHVIDSVLVPPSIDAAALIVADSMEEEPMEEEAMEEEAVEEVGTIVDVAVSNGSFETLVAAVTAADLVDTLSSEGPFTVFAPTDDAFAALPDGLLDALLLPENVDALQAILTYHVLGAEVPSSDVAPGDVDTVQGEAITIAADGDTLTVNDATITAVDVEASNGVIHVIDSVLVPPSIDAAALIVADAAGEEQAAEQGTIIDVATEAGNFTTLLAAGEASGISAVLDAPGEYTIFAPTDEAFEALPEGLVDALLLPENSAALSAILTYHGLLGVVPSSAVEAGDVTTIQGEDITFAIDGDTITINDTATITAVDLEASNGVIHVIDAVLVPPSIDPAALLG